MIFSQISLKISFYLETVKNETWKHFGYFSKLPNLPHILFSVRLRDFLFKSSSAIQCQLKMKMKKTYGRIGKVCLPWIKNKNGLKVKVIGFIDNFIAQGSAESYSWGSAKLQIFHIFNQICTKRIPVVCVLSRFKSLG